VQTRAKDVRRVAIAPASATSCSVQCQQVHRIAGNATLALPGASRQVRRAGSNF
jgi:hypothetical protein